MMENVWSGRESSGEWIIRIVPLAMPEVPIEIRTGYTKRNERFDVMKLTERRLLVRPDEYSRSPQAGFGIVDLAAAEPRLIPLDVGEYREEMSGEIVTSHTGRWMAFVRRDTVQVCEFVIADLATGAMQLRPHYQFSTAAYALSRDSYLRLMDNGWVAILACVGTYNMERALVILDESGSMVTRIPLKHGCVCHIAAGSRSAQTRLVCVRGSVCPITAAYGLQLDRRRR